jgi:hypothetical protein
VLASGCTGDDGPGGGGRGSGQDGGREGAGPDVGGPAALEVTALSTRPRFVTGGDVLVEVGGVPAGADPVLDVGGEQRPGTLAAVGGGRWRGLVEGLPPGPSTVEVAAGGRRGRLEVVDHPLTGPVLSGPHAEPYVCTTERLGLGPPLDDDCTLTTTLRWDYFDTAGALRPLPDRGALPPDVATTRLGDRDVPMVVRTEIGTVNRGVTWVSALDPDPAAEGWTGDGEHFNGDLVYRFGGGCGTSYSQGAPMVGGLGVPTLDRGLLERGYLVATNTLNTFQVHCNDVLSAETAMMVAEHVSERWALPDHTIGEGGSGGAIQQFLIAQNYPGILDAVAASAPFPDAMSIAPGVVDCGLLLSYYDTPEGSRLTDDQRRAVNGHATSATCGAWKASFLATIDPTTGCALPRADIYDPERNPTGARCTLQDSNVNVFGRDPATGFARRPLDNTGVQYGLAAVRDGTISFDEFLALNEGVGGYDLDGRLQPERMRAEEADLRHLAAGGRVVVGTGDLLRLPMVVVSDYSDPTGDIHDRWRAFALRERLARRLAGEPVGGRPAGADEAARPGSDTPNLVVWTGAEGSIVEALTGGRADQRDAAVSALSEWLDALDERGRPADGDPDRDWAAVLGRTRPPTAVDRCTLPDGRVLEGDDVHVGPNECTAAYPLAGDPRRVAGEDLAATTAKCRLSPVDPDAYGVPLTADQEDRLRAAFPDGVCDWSRPGVGAVRTPRPWATY